MPNNPAPEVVDSEVARRLIEGAQAGDRSSLEQLFHLYLPSIEAYVRLNIDKQVRAQESCSDLVQSVCYQVLQNIDRFEHRGEGSFRGWLFVAVLNKIRARGRRLRAAKRNPGQPIRRLSDADLLSAYASVRTPSRDAIAREELRLVESAFDLLPDGDRELIALARVVGLTPKEISAQTGLPASTVRSRLSRAIVRLTKKMVELEDGG